MNSIYLTSTMLILVKHEIKTKDFFKLNKKKRIYNILISFFMALFYFLVCFFYRNITIEKTKKITWNFIVFYLPMPAGLLFKIIY